MQSLARLAHLPTVTEVSSDSAAFTHTHTQLLDSCSPQRTRCCPLPKVAAQPHGPRLLPPLIGGGIGAPAMWPLFGAMISNVCSCANRVQSAPPTPAKPPPRQNPRKTRHAAAAGGRWLGPDRVILEAPPASRSMPRTYQRPTVGCPPPLAQHIAPSTGNGGEGLIAGSGQVEWLGPLQWAVLALLATEAKVAILQISR